MKNIFEKHFYLLLILYVILIIILGIFFFQINFSFKEEDYNINTLNYSNKYITEKQQDKIKKETFNNIECIEKKEHMYCYLNNIKTDKKIIKIIWESPLGKKDKRIKEVKYNDEKSIYDYRLISPRKGKNIITFELENNITKEIIF